MTKPYDATFSMNCERLSHSPTFSVDCDVFLTPHPDLPPPARGKELASGNPSPFPRESGEGLGMGE
jgi:hypothetical protein